MAGLLQCTLKDCSEMELRRTITGNLAWDRQVNMTSDIGGNTLHRKSVAGSSKIEICGLRESSA